MPGKIGLWNRTGWRKWTNPFTSMVSYVDEYVWMVSHVFTPTNRQKQLEKALFFVVLLWYQQKTRQQTTHTVERRLGQEFRCDDFVANLSALTIFIIFKISSRALPSETGESLLLTLPYSFSMLCIGWKENFCSFQDFNKIQFTIACSVFPICCGFSSRKTMCGKCKGSCISHKFSKDF